MSRGLVGFLALVFLFPVALPAQQQQPRARPRLEPIAETRLLMEGLLLPNFKGMDRLLRQKPTEESDWVYLRGQSLLIAETGNLLMLRPPRTAGETAWMSHAGALRSWGEELARAAAERDYERSKARLADLTATCNRCHQTFRVTVRVPFKDEAK